MAWLWYKRIVEPYSDIDLDEGSLLTFVFSKVAIFCYIWKTFKGQSRNIRFTFEVQRSLQTKTLKLQRLLQKPLSGTMLTPLLTHLKPPLSRQRIKTIICLKGLVDPIAERFDTFDIASSSHDLWRNGRFG